MTQFYDNQDRKWMLNLNWDIAEDIKKRVERPDSTPEKPQYFDLFNLTDKDQADCFVLNDPMTGRFNIEKGRAIVRMLYVICEEQCKEREISPEEFGKMLMGTPFSAAREAFMEELGNFIPDPVRKEMFQNILSLADGSQLVALSEGSRILGEKSTALRAQIIRTLNERIDPVWTEVMEKLEKAAEEAGTTSASKSAEGLG